MRLRKFLLTINKGAECYENIEKILEKEKECNYYYIKHNIDDKDKNEHYHIILEYKNQREYESIIKKYQGAHIDKIINFVKAIQYLTHKNDKTKTQYNYDDIITNNKKMLEYYYNEESQEEFDILNESLIFKLIEEHEAKTIIYFYKRFGAKQTIYYRTMILDLLKAIPQERIEHELQKAYETIEEKDKQIEEYQVKELEDFYSQI